MLKLDGKVYIPEKSITRVINDYYNNLISGYLGVTKTIELIRRYYTLPRLRKYIEAYIKEYVIYQQNKVVRYKPYREIQFTEILGVL